MDLARLYALAVHQEEDMKILLATNNDAKVDRARFLIGSEFEILTPAEADLEVIEVKEGSDLRENAKKKAAAYLFSTSLPIVGTDTALHIDGEDLDPAKVRRNALEGVDESELGTKGIAWLMLDYYRAIIKNRGGSVEAYWEDVFAMALPDGKFHYESCTRPIIFTAEVKGPVNVYFPLKSLYVGKVTGMRPFEQSEEERSLEMRPQKDALERLLSLAK